MDASRISRSTASASFFVIPVRFEFVRAGPIRWLRRRPSAMRHRPYHAPSFRYWLPVPYERLATTRTVVPPVIGRLAPALGSTHPARIVGTASSDRDGSPG